MSCNDNNCCSSFNYVESDARGLWLTIVNNLSTLDKFSERPKTVIELANVYVDAFNSKFKEGN